MDNTASIDVNKRLIVAIYVMFRIGLTDGTGELLVLDDVHTFIYAICAYVLLGGCTCLCIGWRAIASTKR